MKMYIELKQLILQCIYFKSQHHYEVKKSSDSAFCPSLCLSTSLVFNINPSLLAYITRPWSCDAQLSSSVHEFLELDFIKSQYYHSTECSVQFSCVLHPPHGINVMWPLAEADHILMN